jgi:hypothetical protein
MPSSRDDDSMDAEFARRYEKSLRDALENLDRIAAETKAMQAIAADEIIKTQEERKKSVHRK